MPRLRLPFFLGFLAALAVASAGWSPGTGATPAIAIPRANRKVTIDSRARLDLNSTGLRGSKNMASSS
jgi:hypothetical protein